MTDVSPAVAAPPQDKPSNSFSRIIGVLFSPIQTFEEIARKPDFIVPIIVIVIVGLAAAIATVPRIDFEAQARQQIESQNLSPAQAEQAMKVMKVALSVTKGAQYVAPVIIIGFLAVVALLYWLGSKMLGGVATYSHVFSVALYGFMPQVIKMLIKIPIVLTKHGLTQQTAETVVRSSPAFLVDFKDNPMLWAFLQRFDVFLLWSLVLMVIGLAAASRMSKAKSAAVVFVVWCIGTLFSVGFGAMAKLRAR